MNKKNQIVLMSLAFAVTQNANAGTITADQSGEKYLNYIQGITDVSHIAERLQPVASFNKDKIKLVANDNGDIKVSAQKRGDKIDGFITFDTEGDKYSGKYIGTIGAVMNPTDFDRLSVSLSNGFPGNDTEKHAYYYGSSITNDVLFPSFMWSSSINATKYKSQSSEFLGYREGDIFKAETGIKKTVDDIEFGVSVNHTDIKQSLPDFEISDKISYDAIKFEVANVAKHGDFVVANRAEYNHGLSLRREGDAPLQGEVSNNWQTFLLETNIGYHNTNVKVGYQLSDDKTPSSEMGAIGGPGKASSIDPSSIEGKSVFYYSLRQQFPGNAYVLPFIGLNGGTADGKHVMAVQLGTKSNFYGGNLQTTVNKTLDTNVADTNKWRFTLSYVKSF